MFEQDGWEVCAEASNGEEAIGKANHLKPDLVVLDLSMPVMNGFTAATILKANHPGIHLILFTAFSHVIKPEVVQQAGFSALIPKEEAGRLLTTAQILLKGS